MATKELSPLEIIENRIQNPLDGRIAKSIGLSQIVGTHGTTVESVYRLARDGYFSGGTHYTDNDRPFHLTPNLRFGGWRREDKFAKDVSSLIERGYDIHPVLVSMEYAESSEPDETGANAYDISQQSRHGVVIGFSKLVMPLAEKIDIDDIRQEAEVVLRAAPSIEAVRVIYPVNTLALNALHKALSSLH